MKRSLLLINTLEHIRWLYTLYLAIDANFRLKMKDRGIKNDKPLGPGWAYMVDDAKLREEVPKHRQPIEVRKIPLFQFKRGLTCSIEEYM